MNQGRIVKLTGGLYTILTNDNKRIEMKPLGIFRHTKVSPKVGDEISFVDQQITEVHPRKNNLTRPPVANVDQAILIHAAKEPDFSHYLLDRFLVLVEKEAVKPVIIVTKMDLLTEEESIELKMSLAYYETYYTIKYTSTKDPLSLTSLKALLADKISVFAGQTGAGKSSLLNALDIKLNLETAAISKALGRGKHTTRHSELINIYGGLVADTPGFSKLDFYDMDADDVKGLYPDFVERAHNCKFRECNHLSEPKCQIKSDVENNIIPRVRYQNYTLIYDEIKKQKKLYNRK